MGDIELIPANRSEEPHRLPSRRVAVVHVNWNGHHPLAYSVATTTRVFDSISNARCRLSVKSTNAASMM
jgi:hypothetical protein